MHILIILLVTILSASCAFKQEVTNDKTSNFEKKQDYPVSYTFGNQEKWLKLKNLLSNDLMSVKELGVIDCRGFDRNSAKLRWIQEVSYNIFNQYYSWYLYQAKDGICVENKALHGSKVTSFFLNLEDSRVLLSASKGYHFEKLGLLHPRILYKRTQFWTLVGTPCGDTKMQFLKDKIISRSVCEESILYKYGD